MPPKGFVCKQCGNCCQMFVDAYQGNPTHEDVALWKKHGRDDILAWVDAHEYSNGKMTYDTWISPKTHDYVNRCPWLRKLPGQNKYKCLIDSVKPELCRNYPKTRKHAMDDGCKGFEP